LKITKIRAYEVNIAFPEPISISYTAWKRVNSILVIVDTDAGLVGYGEAAPFKGITGDNYDESLLFLKDFARALIGKDPSDLDDVYTVFESVSRKAGFSSYTSMAAIDSACYDVIGKTHGRPIYQVLGSEKPRLVPNTITIYLGPPEDTAEKARQLLTRYRKEGLSRIKLKLSGDPKLDLDRVRLVAKVHPGKITLDANQAYREPELAIDLLNSIYDELGSQVVLIEEPCPKKEFSKLKQVTEKSPIPVFADESAATLDDIQRVIENSAAGGINLKLQKIGGIYLGLKAARLASLSDIKIMVGCMMESGVGIAGGASFASGVENVSCTDLDTDLELRSDIITEDSRPSFTNGARVPSGKPGLGIQLTELTSRPVCTIE
jgi:L-alanine-DL-glutamate epimerase-like enolase superfamily enzyme